PEIIRELELARHVLRILPLDGTFTPLPNGDFVWRVDDPAATYRNLARHSQRDAEAYPAYGKVLAAMGRFVKPILAMRPPDPAAMDLEGLRDLAGIAWRYYRLTRREQAALVQLMSASALDFVERWFETD